MYKLSFLVFHSTAAFTEYIQWGMRKEGAILDRGQDFIQSIECKMLEPS